MQSCSPGFYRLRSSGHSPKTHGFPFAWEPHSEDENCICKGWNKDSRGRPPKKKEKRIENQSDTESGEELEDEKEKASCTIFVSAICICKCDTMRSCTNFDHYFI